MTVKGPCPKFVLPTTPWQDPTECQSCGWDEPAHETLGAAYDPRHDEETEL